MFRTRHSKLDLLVTAPAPALHLFGVKRYFSFLSRLLGQQQTAGAWVPGQVQSCFERRLVPRPVADVSVDGRAKETVGEKFGCVFVLL